MILYNFIFIYCNIGYVVQVFYNFFGKTECSTLETDIPMILVYLGNFNLSVWGLLNALTIGVTPLLVREIRKRMGLRVDDELKETVLTTLSQKTSASLGVIEDIKPSFANYASSPDRGV
jgi:hypothetical protein